MSPGNPTGATLSAKEKQEIADLARAKNIVVISDEIYELFTYSGEAKSLLAYYPGGTLSVGGLSKTLAMTGWRIGWTAGPKELIEELIKLQQFTFVCAPSAAQKAALSAFDIDLSEKVGAYRKKRDLMSAIQKRLLLVPGNVFSNRDSHFRISYAASDATLAAAIEVFKALS